MNKDATRNNKTMQSDQLQKMSKIMDIKFAPIRIPFHRRLETLAVAAAYAAILCGGTVTAGVLLYLILFTTYWMEALFYIIWIYVIDTDICDKGGRRIKWVRDWLWWKYAIDYFPVQLLQASKFNLDPKRNYLFCCFPHGVLPNGVMLGFGTNWSKYSDLFPHHVPYMLTLKQNFLFPGLRDLFLSMGTCSVSKDSLNYLLGNREGGNVAALTIGGAAEAFTARPRQYKIVVKNRKGFVRIALQHGSPLVPVFSFGENEVYNQVDNPENSLLRKFQDWLKSKTGIAVPVVLGRGFFQYSFGFLPHRNPIHTVVAEPIDVKKVENPNQEQIDELHMKFLEKIQKLFDDYKALYLENGDKIMLEII